MNPDCKHCGGTGGFNRHPDPKVEASYPFLGPCPKCQRILPKKENVMLIIKTKKDIATYISTSPPVLESKKACQEDDDEKTRRTTFNKFFDEQMADPALAASYAKARAKIDTIDRSKRTARKGDKKKQQ